MQQLKVEGEGRMGAWLGWQALPAVLLAASLGGLCFALWLRAAGRAVPGQHLVFGPWLALGGGGCLLLGLPA